MALGVTKDRCAVLESPGNRQGALRLTTFRTGEAKSESPQASVTSLLQAVEGVPFGEDVKTRI